MSAGCAVPQPAGGGKLLHNVEPQTRRGYFLYLPQDYAQQVQPNLARRWPVVVTFHGMKPFDNSDAQAHEWQCEADNYGLIVIAPHLKTSDLFMEFPLKNTHSYVKEDEQAVLAIIQEVFRTTQADSTRVLATSWSSGGYMAHYMVNHHPNLFTCLAPRQSNFSPAILDPANVPYYLDTPIGIFFGENDFAICRTESTDAVKWYREHGFRFVDGRVVVGLGHERTPQTAAGFFARTSKPPIQPVRPVQAQESLAKLRLIPAEFAGITDLPEPQMSPRTPAEEILKGRPEARPTPALVAAQPATGGSNRDPSRLETSPPSRLLAANVPAAGPSYGPAAPNPPQPQAPKANQPRPAPAQPTTPNPAQPTAPASSPIRVSVSTRIGLAPLHVSFGVQMPAEMMQGATCAWTDNDEPICTGFTGQRILAAPGDHVIGVAVVTRDRREYRSWTTVKVLPRQPALR